MEEGVQPRRENRVRIRAATELWASWQSESDCSPTFVSLVAFASLVVLGI